MTLYDHVTNPEGKFYEPMQHSLELAEVAVQTYQALQSSILNPHAWISLLITATLALNCAAVASIDFFTFKGHRRRIGWIIFVDAVFDVIAGAILPLIRALPLLIQFGKNLDPYSLPFNSIIEGYDLINLYSVQHPLDLFGLVLQLVGCHVRCEELAIMDAEDRGSTKSPRNKEVSVQERRSRKAWLWKVLFTLYGLFVSSVGIHSLTSSDCSDLKGMCTLNSYPWLPSTSCHCLALEALCLQNRELDHENITQVVEQAIDDVRDSVVGIFAGDCPIREVQQPQRPKHLAYFTFWNCPLESFEWDIRDWNYLEFVVLSGTFDRIPETLRYVPESLRNIAIYGGSIEELPPWVEDAWQNLNTLWVMEGQLKEFPPQIRTLPNLEALILAFNDISEIPAWTNFKQLDMTGNQLHSIPEELKNTAVLTLGANHIPLDGLPWSVPEILKRNIRLRGNPACEDSRIAKTSVCTDGCSATCPSSHLRRPFCYLHCNSTECGFHEGRCLP